MIEARSIIWFGLIVGPTVPIKDKWVRRQHRQKICAQRRTFKAKTKIKINFYDSMTTCERYAIGNWIQCDNNCFNVWLCLPYVFHVSWPYRYRCKPNQLFCTCFDEANTEHDFFILISLREVSTTTEAKIFWHPPSPQSCFKCRRRWSVSILVAFFFVRQNTTSSNLKRMLTIAIAIVTISTTPIYEYRRERKQKKREENMKHRWMQSDIKLKSGAEIHSKLSQSVVKMVDK